MFELMPVIGNCAATCASLGLSAASEVCVNIYFKDFGRGEDFSIAPFVLIHWSPVSVEVSRQSLQLSEGFLIWSCAFYAELFGWSGLPAEG